MHEPNGATLATYYAVCHGHPEHEVALDFILGSWGDDADYSDHETFSCIWRPWPQGVLAVDAFVTVSFPDGEDTPAEFGRPMSREDALQSPRIKTVWAITDALATTVDPITEQVMPRHGRKRRRARGGANSPGEGLSYFFRDHWVSRRVSARLHAVSLMGMHPVVRAAGSGVRAAGG